jgi:hypothetical protein
MARWPFLQVPAVLIRSYCLVGAYRGENIVKPTFKAASIGMILFLLSAGAVLADPADEVRAAYRHFVEVQNAHDISSLTEILSDSPAALFVSGSTPIWGREALLKRFETLYRGTLHFDPNYDDVKVDTVAPVGGAVGGASRVPRGAARPDSSTKEFSGDPGLGQSERCLEADDHRADVLSIRG